MKKRNQSCKMVKVREYLMSVSKFGCCYYKMKSHKVRGVTNEGESLIHLLK